MIEPLLGIAFEDRLAMARRHYRAANGRETVILLEQVYDNVRAQENLEQVCRLCAGQAGIRLVTVEGSDTQLAPLTRRQSVEELINSNSQVSAGVLHLQQSDPGLIEVFGVDEMTMNRRSQTAMITVLQNASLREKVFSVLRPVLAAAQKRCYGDAVARLRGGSLKLMSADLSINQQTALIKKSAGEVGLDLNDYPQVRRFDEIRLKEKQLRYWLVRIQMAIFVRRVHQRIFSWYKFVGKNQLEINLEKAKPVLEYWMEATGIAPEELDQNVTRRGLESVLLECKRWFENWISASTRQRGVSSGEGSHVYLEEMIRLALRLDVDFFGLRDFREYVAINRDTASLKLGLLDEIAVVSRELIGRLPNPDSMALFELEESLDLYYRALRFELTPSDAETAEIDPGKFASLITDLEKLAGMPLPPDIRTDVEGLGRILAEAELFLKLSRQRGDHMVQRTLELMHERAEDRAVLVAGGFHGRAITRSLEDSHGVSWSVLAPTPDLEEARRKMSSR